MGVVAAVSAAGFAQTDFTGKLLNADMERGVIGWDVVFEGSDLWKKVIKNQSSQPGYYGVHNSCLEVWKSSGEAVGNTAISQSLKNLPNGTYVFGAYMAATTQEQEDVRETIEGVTIFAGEATVNVATNAVQGMDTIWAHTSKFNVAAAVADGTLKVGVEVNATNANFVLMDNATLYYFGEMEPAAALDAMAKIDIAAMLEIADTCLDNKMNAGTLAALNEAMETAKALTADAGLYHGIEVLGWNIRQSVKSIKEYDKFAAALAAAREVAAKDWTEEVADPLAALVALIEELEARYNEGSIETAEMEPLKNSLAEAAALVELDEVYINIDIYDEKIDELEVGEEVGEYLEEAVAEMSNIMNEIGSILDEVEEGVTSALEAMTACTAMFAQIDALIAAPNTADDFPITIPRDTKSLNNKTILKGSYLDDDGLAHYKSKTFSFDYPLARVRFIVKESGGGSKDKGSNGGYPFIAISEFTMYDENDNPIELTVDMLSTNADYNSLNNKVDGAGLAGLIDDDPSTYFHSTYNVSPNDYHYIEVALPEDTYNAFSFSMSARSNSEFHTGQFPAVLEIVHLSEAVANLQSAVAAAKKLTPCKGTDPGFYNMDIVPFTEALAAAEALIDTEATESEVVAAVNTLTEEMTKLEEAKVMPTPGKKYRIVSAYSEFFRRQNVQKAFTVRGGQLWWETASPDSLQQEFTLEAVPNEESSDLFYRIRNVSDGGCVSRKDSTGFYPVHETADSLILIPLGKGEFSFRMPAESTVLHPCDHNSGVVGAGWTGNVYGTGGGLFGDYSRVTNWGSASAGTVCAWYIRELSVLPCATKSISDLRFETETIHLYEGVNTLTLTADKDCAFSDLVIYDLFGEEIPMTYSVNGAVATAILDVVALESFSFVFNNAEGVAEVAVDGRVSTLSALLDAYEEALAVSPVKGDEVGLYGDLTGYETALAQAEKLLASGGSDEEIQLAVNALGSAVAHLGDYLNYPEADKTYFLLSDYADFYTIHGVDMALFAREDMLTWSYANIGSETYRWKFVEGDATAEGKRAFYIQNVATELYVGAADAKSVELFMVEDTDETQTFSIFAGANGEVSLCDGRHKNDMFLHFNSHSSGAGVFGTVIYWGASAASNLRIVESEAYIQEYRDMVGIENIDVEDKYVAPAVKGIYDLYGRRIDTPATTGIYIVDGKKTVIKK